MATCLCGYPHQAITIQGALNLLGQFEQRCAQFDRHFFCVRLYDFSTPISFCECDQKNRSLVSAPKATVAPVSLVRTAFILSIKGIILRGRIGGESRRVSRTSVCHKPKVFLVYYVNIFYAIIAFLSSMAANLTGVSSRGLRRFRSTWRTIGRHALEPHFLLTAFVFLLGRSGQVLLVGAAYVVWTGVGAVGTVWMGVVLFGESLDPARVVCIAFVIVGLIGLRLDAGSLYVGKGETPMTRACPPSIST
jgi:multidrug transporter EmrE-like cation transporter